MTLPQPAAAYENNIFSAVDEIKMKKIFNLLTIDFVRMTPLELVKRLWERQFRVSKSAFDRAFPAPGDFTIYQINEEVKM